MQVLPLMIIVFAVAWLPGAGHTQAGAFLWALASASDNSLTGQRTRRTMDGEGPRPLTWQGRRGRAWQGARGGARRGTACLAWRGGAWHSRTARTDRRQTWRRDTSRRWSVPPVV
jgi:hypothetical protein